MSENVDAPSIDADLLVRFATAARARVAAASLVLKVAGLVGLLMGGGLLYVWKTLREHPEVAAILALGAVSLALGVWLRRYSDRARGLVVIFGLLSGPLPWAAWVIWIMPLGVADSRAWPGKEFLAVFGALSIVIAAAMYSPASVFVCKYLRRAEPTGDDVARGLEEAARLGSPRLQRYATNVLRRASVAAPAGGVVNNSGQGPGTTVPAEVRGWSWAAFLMNWIWAIPHRAWLGLGLSLGGGLGDWGLWYLFHLHWSPLSLIAWIVCGIKGNEWAWQNRRWESTQEFRDTQRVWVQWWLALFVLGLAMMFMVAITKSQHIH